MTTPDSTSAIKSPTKIPHTITRVMSWGYGFGIGFQNRRFDRGIGVSVLDVPVISIGNLSTGGTGKTPMVHWVANELLTMGKHPAIAMRGYKAPPGEMGDEEQEHRQALPDVPVVAQRDRIAGLRALFETEPMVDSVILDDGFQHRQIARGLDIVLIDASRPPYRDALLPRGFLRDPVSSLARADAIVVTHREMVSAGGFDKLVRWIGAQVPACPVAVTAHAWESVQVYTPSGSGSGAVSGWDTEVCPLDRCVEQRVLGVCAIGNPEGFLGMIDRGGWDLVDSLVLDDHDRFGEGVVEGIVWRAKACNASALCMTRKDWVKAGDLLAGKLDLPVVVPDLAFRFESGGDGIRSLMAELEET